MILARRSKSIFSRRKRSIRIANQGRFVFFVCLVAALVLFFCFRTIYAVRKKVEEYNRELEASINMEIGDLPGTKVENGSSVGKLPSHQGQNGPVKSAEKIIQEGDAGKGNEEIAEVNDNEESAEVMDGEKITGVEKETPIKGKASYKELFADTVFLGDSITESLGYYKFIDKSNVIADKGLTVSDAIKRVEEVANLKPKNIFIMFGMNDVLSLDKSEGFIKNYTKLVDELQARLPDTHIYVQSILYVDPKVRQKKPRLTNDRIDEFNNALQSMSSGMKNVDYIDLNTIVKNYNEDLHEKDGIHYVYKFYKLWLNYIKEYV